MVVAGYLYTDASQIKPTEGISQQYGALSAWFVDTHNTFSSYGIRSKFVHWWNNNKPKNWKQ